MVGATSQKMMNIARNFKSAQSADLFPRKVQSLLSTPSTPETARTKKTVDLLCWT